MKKRKYQEDYAAGRPQMYDINSRKKKAANIVAILKDYYKDKENLKNLRLLDVGSSSGIIDAELARSIGKVNGIDIDKKAVQYAKKKYKRNNLVFKYGDALNIPYKDNYFDMVVCTHVYEHVPDPDKLFSEIYRVLKKDGVCYLAAQNKLWPYEPHHNLLFLSWLPKKLANQYISIFRNKKEYYETPLTYWGLKKLTKKFSLTDYTPLIIKNPDKFNYKTIPSNPLVKILAPLSTYLSPTFFWILKK